MLKIQVKDHTKTSQQNAIWVVERLYSLGSDPSDNLILIDDSISPHHASLITLDKRLYLKDNDSACGCFVNNQKVTKQEVTPGDIVRLGKVEILVMDPRDSLSQDTLSEDDIDNCWSLIADGSFLTGQEFYIHKNCSVIGRGSQCDIVLPGTHLSRQHAQLKIQGSFLHICDLASANGTYVNGERISQGIARPGDQIRFDAYSFRVTGPLKDKNKTQLRTPPINRPTDNSNNDPSSTDKRWQIRPTSPGNRIVEEDVQTKGRQFTTIIILVAMLATLAYLIYPILAG